MSNIKSNLNRINQSIQQFAAKYHRPPQSIALLAIAKGRSIEAIQQAIDAGQYRFGENYLQEALDKMAALKHPQLEWHFTGHLQTNKTRGIAENFSWVHTVTNKKHAQRLSEQRPAHLPPLQVCLEVNVSGELSKGKVMSYEELLELAQYCQTLPRLKLRGLMTIPAPKDSFEEQRQELHKLVMIKEKLEQDGIHLDSLSMGMTNDLEAAIAEGATLLRIGRGIFAE